MSEVREIAGLEREREGGREGNGGIRNPRSRRREEEEECSGSQTERGENGNFTVRGSLSLLFFSNFCIWHPVLLRYISIDPVTLRIASINSL